MVELFALQNVAFLWYRYVTKNALQIVLKRRTIWNVEKKLPLLEKSKV